MHNPQARSGSYFPSLRVEYLHTYLEFLGVLSLLFIYLYLYGLMDIYFILWGIIQYNFILFFCLNCSIFALRDPALLAPHTSSPE